MKKVKFLTVLLGATLIAGTGCLKDKGYDNNEYGINDPNNSPAGLGFHKGVAYKVNVGLDLSPDPQVINNQAVIMLMAGKPAQQDISITLSVDPTIVDRYNTNFGTSIEVLPASDYTLSTTFVIPKGAKQVNVPITVGNTSGLDANTTYGIGIKIASADAGYVLASNQRELLLSIGLKNRWDGVYNLRGYHNRTPYTFPYETEINIETFGPTSDIFFWPAVDSYGHPIGVGPNNSLSWYGDAISPVIVFDPATDLVTDVYNNSTAATITMFTNTSFGAGVSRYDASTKTIYVYWNYNNNPLRAFFDTLTYIGPR